MGIFTQKNQTQPRVVQVRAKHFYSLKLAIAAGLIMVMVLMAAIMKLNNQVAEQAHENTRLHSQIAALQNRGRQNHRRSHAGQF
jgi:cell division protein FtsL